MSETHPLYTLMARLEKAGIYFTLARDRPDTVRVDITVPGERVEIDVFDDGHLEASRFPGSEDVLDGETVVAAVIARELEDSAT